MRRIAFSLCSNNYLAKARVGGESFLRFHPDYEYVIFLVDQPESAIDYASFAPIEVIPISTVIDNVEELARKYNIMELNTSVKAGVFLHLFETTQAEWILYLDPDLMVLDRFSEVEQLLGSGSTNLVITPHGLSPIDDGKVPSEVHLCRYGIYNLGFIGVAHTAESKRFLSWWNDRLMKYCYVRPEDGLFTDQSWINYAPSYFEGVHILKHPGYNVANWNLYERAVSLRDGAYFINDFYRLRFFHFSHYKFATPYLLSSQQNRHTIDNYGDVKLLIAEYQRQLLQNRQEFYQGFVCAYTRTYEAARASVAPPPPPESGSVAARIIKAPVRLLLRLARRAVRAVN